MLLSILLRPAIEMSVQFTLVLIYLEMMQLAYNYLRAAALPAFILMFYTTISHNQVRCDLRLLRFLSLNACDRC